MPILQQALVEALQTMAFMEPLPAENPVLPLDGHRMARIDFSGPFNGSIELAATQNFGASLAANVAGTNPMSEDAIAQASDSIKELLNVTCGLFLARVGSDVEVAMTVPTLLDLADLRVWQTELASGDAIALEVEGHLLLACIREKR